MYSPYYHCGHLSEQSLQFAANTFWHTHVAATQCGGRMDVVTYLPHPVNATLSLRFLRRDQLNLPEWDRCVAEAHNALLYGHSWYLDAVTDVPGNGSTWRWEGLVQTDEAGRYVAAMPVPLRRRWGRWVVYQPLFCQFLAIFSAQSVDPVPFIEALVKRYRYASRLCLRLNEPISNVPEWVGQAVLHTHVLRLVVEPHPYAAPPASATQQAQPIGWERPIADAHETHRNASLRYTADRRMNLRRAHRRVDDTPGWQVRSSTDIRPLLALFQENHAAEIGVGEWAYGLFEQLFATLQQRRLGTLRYACVNDVPVAGAFFAEQHGRIMYLFNAANAEGRRLNARTLLLDEALQNAATRSLPAGLLFDFESPDKPSVVQFYESFGATPEPYVQLRWSRLTWVEKMVQSLVKAYRVLQA